jgi:hypothetical protein
MNMVPNTSDQGSGGGGAGGGGSASDTTTSPSGSTAGGISPGDRMRFLHENGIEVIGPDTTQSNSCW